MSPGSLQTRSRISAATLAGDRRSPVGWIGALILHAAIVFATLFTFAHKLEIAEESPPVIPVDLVTIGAKTNIVPTVKVQPKAPPKQETPVEPPKPEPSPIQPPQQAQETPPPPPEQAPAEQVVKIPPPPPMPKLKPQPTETPPKQEKFDINNISALLDKRAPAASSAPNARLADRTLKGFGAQNAMTADIVAAIQSQMSRCYTPPIGAPKPDDLIVDFVLFLNQDGSVARAPQLTEQSAATVASNTYTRASAEAARRAIYECAPFKLPADKYNLWQEINPFHFDPRQMMGE